MPSDNTAASHCVSHIVVMVTREKRAQCCGCELNPVFVSVGVLGDISSEIMDLDFTCIGKKMFSP